MAKSRKRMTDEERAVLKAAGKRIEDEAQWWYEHVKTFRGKITPEQIKEIEDAAEARGGLIHLTAICDVVKWKKGKDTPIRNRLQALSNRIMITKGDYGSYYIFQILKRGLKEDVEDATDFFLTKKEGKAVKRRRKREAKSGETRREIKGVMTDDEKKAARKERVRIRKEAAKLGITTEEYKAQNAEKKPEPADPAALPEPEVDEKPKKKRKRKPKVKAEEAPKKSKAVSRKPPGANRTPKKKRKSTKKRATA